MKKPNWKRFAKERVYSFWIWDTIDLCYEISRDQLKTSSYFYHKHTQFCNKLMRLWTFTAQFEYAKKYAKKKNIGFDFTRINKDV